MSNEFLESFYENVILPRYSDQVTFKKINWKDHGKFNLDAWAHYFDDENGREYVLVYEDDASLSQFDDGLTHEMVPIGESGSLKLSFSDKKEVINITGCFTLYREKRQGAPS